MAFLLSLTQDKACDLDLRKRDAHLAISDDIDIPQYLKTFILKIVIFTFHSLFFQKRNCGEIVESALLCLLSYPQSDHAPKKFILFYLLGFSQGRCHAEKCLVFNQGLISREIFGISKPFPNTKTILMLISNKIVSKRIQIILMDRVSIKLNFSMSVSTSENVK